MRILGRQFVLGRTIEEALKRAARICRRGLSLLLRHAGRGRLHEATMPRAITTSYRDALTAIARAFPRPQRARCSSGPSISVKLSALHPRYEWIKRERIMAELLPAAGGAGRAGARRQSRAHHRCRGSRAPRPHARCLRGDGRGRSIARLERTGPCGAGLSEARAAGDCLACRSGQAAGPPYSGAAGEGRLLGHRDQARAGTGPDRLSGVHAQGGDRHVLSRRCARAVCGGRCDLSAIRHPQRAHACRRCRCSPAAARISNFSACTAWARRCTSSIARRRSIAGGAGTRIYAPVGTHEDLLAYLVRRLLENGANTSFVNRLADEDAPIEDIIADPVERLMTKHPRRNPRIPKPRDLLPDRKNSSGFLWSDPAVATRCMDAMHGEPASSRKRAGPIISGKEPPNPKHAVFDPSDRTRADRRSHRSHRRRCEGRAGRCMPRAE